jgi:hypothetical protein
MILFLISENISSISENLGKFSSFKENTGIKSEQFSKSIVHFPTISLRRTLSTKCLKSRL